MAVTGGGKFSNAEHLRTLSEEQHDGKKNRDVAYESRIMGLVSGLKVTDKRLLLCAKSIYSTTVSSAVLFATEFRIFNVLAIISLP